MRSRLIGERRTDAQEVVSSYAAATPRGHHGWIPATIIGLLLVGAALSLADQHPGPAQRISDGRHTLEYGRQVEAVCERWTLQAAPGAHFTYLDRSLTWEDGQGWTTFEPWSVGGRPYTTRCTTTGDQLAPVIIEGHAGD